MAAITAFRNDLFQPIQGNSIPNVNKTGGDRYYCIVGGQELGIEERKADGSIPGPKDLKELSAFVRDVLSDKAKLEPALEGRKIEEKIYLHVNLTQISAYISNHNHHVNESFLIGFVHVLLLILTLGMFKYRDTLQIERIATSLDALGVTDKTPLKRGDSLYKIPFVTLLAMGPKDQEFLLEKAGLLDKWQAFLKERPDFVDTCVVEPSQEAFLAPMTLADLTREADFNDTALALVFPKQNLDVEEEKHLADRVLVPYLENLEAADTAVFSHVPTKILSQLSCKDLFSFSPGQQKLLLERAGLSAKWDAFAAIRPTLQQRIQAFCNSTYLETLRLETLQNASSIEKTSFALVFPREMEGVQVIFWLVDELYPALKAMAPEERRAFIRGLPGQVKQSVVQMAEAFKMLEQVRPMLANPMVGPQLRAQLEQDEKTKSFLPLLDLSEAQIAIMKDLVAMVSKGE